MRRPKARFGCYLQTVPAAPFLSTVPDFMQPSVEGLALVETTRPYLTKAGKVHLRLVFRGRADDIAVVLSYTLSGQLAPDVSATLSAALGPGLRLLAQAEAAA